MKKWTPTIIVEPHEEFSAKLTFPYSPAVNEKLKDLGGRWNPDIKAWTVPLDLAQQIEQIADNLGMKYENRLPVREASKTWGITGTVNTKLYPYQREAVLNTLAQKATIYAFEMGLGKTATAIERLRLEGYENILVVCPAMVCLTWEDEFRTWWPAHPPITVLSARYWQRVKRGKEVVPTSGIFISSYEMLKNLPDIAYQAIVFDEVHYLASAKSARSGYSEDAVKRNSGATLVGLTGTLIPNKIENLWNPLNILQPGAWGSWHGFTKRYCEITENEYSRWIVGGLRSDRASELHTRLAKIAIRKTKSEVAHLLPKLQMMPIFIEPDFVVNGFDLTDLEALQEFMETAQDVRVARTLDLVEELVEQGVTRHAVVCYHKSVGKALAGLFAELGPTFYVDGEMDIAERRAEIQKAAGLEKSFLVCTMSSIGIGLNDLANFANVVLAELYWQPATMAQLLARFHRLNSRENVTIRAIILKGTVDEVIAYTLKAKLTDIGKVLESGTVEEKLTHSIWKEPTKEEMLEQLRQIAEEHGGREDWF